MNFTRDPIIETVITPKEGCKLVVRNSKVGTAEEYLVEALEVVSFGTSLFFRSKEKPKVFLVPVSDYEVFELKEARMALKNASHDRSIKIGGGKEPSKPQKEESVSEGSFSEKSDRKRDKQRRRSRRKDKDRSESQPEEMQEKTASESGFSSQESAPVQPPSPSFISKLFPPPQTLIRETISRYKLEDPAEEDILPLAMEELPQPETFSSEESIEEPKEEIKPPEEE